MRTLIVIFVIFKFVVITLGDNLPIRLLLTIINSFAGNGKLFINSSAAANLQALMPDYLVAENNLKKNSIYYNKYFNKIKPSIIV